MNKLVHVALSIAVALGVFYAVKSLKQEAVNRDPTAAEVAKVMDDLRARAEREHPDLAITEAVKQLATVESAKKLATQTSAQRADTAASMFWGFYWLNTEARVDYCRQRGVDLAPFTVLFERNHAAELARATAVYAAAGVDPADHLSMLTPELAKFVKQDMQDVTNGAQVPLAQACELFNENAEGLVEFIQLPPHVRDALLSG